MKRKFIIPTEYKFIDEIYKLNYENLIFTFRYDDFNDIYCNNDDCEKIIGKQILLKLVSIYDENNNKIENNEAIISIRSDMNNDQYIEYSDGKTLKIININFTDKDVSFELMTL